MRHVEVLDNGGLVEKDEPIETAEAGQHLRADQLGVEHTLAGAVDADNELVRPPGPDRLTEADPRNDVEHHDLEVGRVGGFVGRDVLVPERDVALVAPAIVAEQQHAALILSRRVAIAGRPEVLPFRAIRENIEAMADWVFDKPVEPAGLGGKG